MENNKLISISLSNRQGRPLHALNEHVAAMRRFSQKVKGVFLQLNYLG